MSIMPLSARIAELAGLLDGTAITLLTLSEGGETLTLRRDATPAPARSGAEGPIPADGLAVAAPCPGLFMPGHPLRDEPLAVPGQVVTAGTVLGLLRAGPLLLQVAAPWSGTVLAVEAAQGQLVGYGFVLFRLLPEAEEESPCPST